MCVYVCSGGSDSLKGLCIASLLAKIQPSDNPILCANCSNPSCSRVLKPHLRSDDETANILVQCLLVATADADKQRCINWIAADFDNIAPTKPFIQNVILTNPQLMVQIVKAKALLAAADRRKKEASAAEAQSDGEELDEDDGIDL